MAGQRVQFRGIKGWGVVQSRTVAQRELRNRGQREEEDVAEGMESRGGSRNEGVLRNFLTVPLGFGNYEEAGCRCEGRETTS